MHDGNELFKNYDHFENKIESQKDKHNKQTYNNVDVDEDFDDYESDEFSEFEEDDCKIICGEKDLSKYFCIRKLSLNN